MGGIRDGEGEDPNPGRNDRDDGNVRSRASRYYSLLSFMKDNNTMLFILIPLISLISLLSLLSYRSLQTVDFKYRYNSYVGVSA